MRILFVCLLAWTAVSIPFALILGRFCGFNDEGVLACSAAGEPSPASDRELVETRASLGTPMSGGDGVSSLRQTAMSPQAGNA
jgi:hypothetical protein